METGAVTAAMDRANGRIFLFSYLLVYFAAPVTYIGIVQAVLCDKLGTGATVANLPFAAYQAGQFAPIILAWLTPHRMERPMVLWSNSMTASVLSAVALTLILPAPVWLRIGVLIAQGLIQGVASSASQVFMLQCLNRGTTLAGRARALKYTFTLGPLSAVVGSLGAQYVLNPGFRGLPYPYDFALLYLVGVPCMMGVALLSRGYQLVRLDDEPRQPLFRFLANGFREYSASRPLLLLWFAYLFWNSSIGGLGNLSLYARQALGRDPKDFSGLMMALRFGCKSLGGYLLGAIAVRRSLRTSALVSVAFVGASVIWGWLVPGYAYLFAFGLMGAGELGGMYIPNCTLALSSLANGTRNLSLLTLATPVSGLAPAIHGALADRFGFSASFAFGLAAAVLAFLLILRTPKPQAKKD
jgi:hypothetical protein